VFLFTDRCVAGTPRTKGEGRGGLLCFFARAFHVKPRPRRAGSILAVARYWQRPMTLQGIQYVLQHPRLLRLRHHRFESSWATASDLACSTHDTVQVARGACLTSQNLACVLAGLFARHLTIVACNVAISLPRGAIKCNFLAGTAEGRTVVGVIVCRSAREWDTCREHAGRVRRALQSLVRAPEDVTVYVAQVYRGGRFVVC